jgi:hypothetical protein
MCYVVNDTGIIVAGPMDEQTATNVVEASDEELYIMHG